jgi:hypothetical protein
MPFDSSPHPALRAPLSLKGRGALWHHLAPLLPSPLEGEGASRSEAGEGKDAASC